MNGLQVRVPCCRLLTTVPDADFVPQLQSNTTRSSFRCWMFLRNSGRRYDTILRYVFVQVGQPEQATGIASQLLQTNEHPAAAVDEATPMDECPHVVGVPSMVGVPVHSKDPDARRAFHYQYSVASAWWQRWYQRCGPCCLTICVLDQYSR